MNVNLDVIDVPCEVSSGFGLVWAAVEVEEVTRTVLLLAPHYDGSLGRQHQHQQVPVLALGAEHGRLRAHLAPVPPRAGLGQTLEEHLVLVIVTGALQNIFP